MANRCGICEGRKAPPCDHCGRGQEATTPRIEIMRNILKRHTAAVIDRFLVDAMTANAYVTVHDALSPANRETLEAKPLPVAVNIVWKLVK